jgi:tetratricopeptide (TPR) repeat protein
MRPGRNDPCPCGSGKRYKHCCGRASAASPGQGRAHPQQIGMLIGLIDQGRVREAEAQAEGLLKVHPNEGLLWKILGVALLRQGSEALPALRKAAELMPQDAEAHGNLGAALADRGQWQEALASLSRSLQLQPRNAEAIIDAANALRALRRPAESVPLYERALQIDPRSAEAHNNLGNALFELSRWSEALACYQRALEIQPDDAQIHCNLANTLRQLGRLDEALTSGERAIALEPRSSVAHNNLGLVLVALGRREEAVTSFRQALALKVEDVDALMNLGNVLRDLGEREEALTVYRQAVDLDSHRADAHCNLGNVLFDMRRLDEAAACFRTGLEAEPRCAKALVGLTAALRMQGKSAEAEASCRAALALEPHNVEALSLLGELHADRGQFTQAEEHFQRALAIDPSLPSVYCSLVTHRRMTNADTAWLRGAQGLLGKPLPLGHEISLHYAVGKYFDDLGEYEKAFDHFRRANELTKRYRAGYHRDRLAQRVDRIIRTFNAELMRECRQCGSDSELPVLIVGMPRSGTSLTEHILASHPAVFGGGELRFWEGAFTAFEAATARGESRADLLAGIARDYLERLRALSGEALRVVDKMPANFLYAGLIHAALPQARIIHMQRHPLDTCLSIYFQNFFNMGRYAHDLDDLAHYYGEYARITRHWRTVLPTAALLEIPYEGLIGDQERWTRRMLEFLGLPWDPRCLEFHRTERVVITASRWQVRQKISSASAGRWRNYERHIGPLRELLQLVDGTEAMPDTTGPWREAERPVRNVT